MSKHDRGIVGSRVEPTKPPRIALVAGQWGQNIGNAFFNLGGRYVLEQVFGCGAVGFHQDQPNYRTLHNKFTGNPSNYADLIREADIDALVLQGPVLNAWLGTSWEQTFRVLRGRGIKVIFHSAAFFKFTKSEIDAVRKTLEEYPPSLICTRDGRTFDILKDWLPTVPKFSGIDAGFFLPKVVTPISMCGQKSVCFNFDRYPEPTIISEGREDPGPWLKQIELLGKQVFLKIPRRLSRLSHRSKIAAYFGDLTDRRRLPNEWEGHRILRPEHRFFPHVTHKIYRNPGSFCSDEPWTYASAYANAEATLSDRVHACVASLAYGREAMLFTPSPRSALFERVGLGDIRNRVVTLPSENLEAAQSGQIDWLRKHV